MKKLILKIAKQKTTVNSRFFDDFFLRNRLNFSCRFCHVLSWFNEMFESKVMASFGVQRPMADFCLFFQGHYSLLLHSFAQPWS